MTTETTIHGHRSPWFGKTVVRALATAAIVVAALLFALQSPVHAQEEQAGTVALSTTTPQVGVAITASLTDPNGGITGTTWQWSSSDTSGGTYTDISGATSASYTPVAADSGKYLKATASYTDSHGSGKSAEKVADSMTSLIAVTVSISVPDASVAEGDSATVTVTLSADPKRTVVIPITTTNVGGASDDDYSGVPENVTFNSGDTTKTFTFMAVDDTDADHGSTTAGNRVDLGFGTLPDAVSEGTDATITISIVDDDPAVRVSFASATYSVDEGFIARVSVTLTAAPMRPLRIPFSANFLGGATAADFEADNKTEITFGQDETSITFSYRTAGDEVADHGESVRLSFGTLPPGVTAGGTPRTTITIIDDDPAVTVDIGAQDTSVTEGGSGKLAVVLSEDPKRPVVIPVTATGAGGATSVDYSVQANVTFNSGQTFKEIPFTATGDTDPDHGESVEFGFGSDLPPGVTEGTDSTVTVTIIDDDPPVTVSFGSATHTGAEGDAVTLTVSLNAAPQRPLTIPITLTPLGGAEAADVLVTSSVSFGTGDTEQQFDAVLADDPVADHGESLRFSFGTLPPGVTASGTTRTTVTIIDDDPAVTVEFGSTTYSTAENTSATVTVTLSEDPKRPLTIPITSTAQGSTTADDYRITPTEVTFASGQTSRILQFSALPDTTPDDGDSVKLGFGTDLPPGVTAGDDDETTVTIIDDDPAVTVNFGAGTYSVDESGTVDVTVTLSEDPQRELKIPIHAAGQSGATPADYEPPGSVTFASGDTSKTFAFTPEDDTVDDDGEQVRLSFGPLPPGVTRGSGLVATVVSINDDDDPRVTVMFGSATYSVNEKNNGTVTVTVGLSADPERTVSIPLTTTYGGTADSTAIRDIPSTMSFSSGETSKTFVVTARDDFIDNDGRTATITFGSSLPSRVSLGGTIDETVVSVTDDDTRGFTITPTSATVGENATTTYSITLKSEPSDTVTVTVNDPTDSDDATASPSTLSFTPGQYTDGALTVTVTTTDDEVDEPTEIATVTHTVSGGDYGDNNVTIPNFVVTITDDDETPVITGEADPEFAEIEHDADPETFDLTVATYSATDGDGDDITWSMLGDASSQFTMTENSDGDGVLSINTAPDFENPGPHIAVNAYYFNVTASDGTNTAILEVSVTITNVNERPIVTRIAPSEDPSLVMEPAYDTTVAGSDLTVATFFAQDLETDSMAWSLGGEDAGDFSTVGTLSFPGISEINVSFKSRSDYENPTDEDKDNQYDIIVISSDGEKTTETPFTVIVTDINERPDIDEDTVADYAEIEYDFTGTPGNVHTFTAEDYDDGDTFTWSLEGDDEGDFEIGSATGVLTFAQDSSAGPRPNFETPLDMGSNNVYEVTVVATDDDSTALSSRHAVTVKVTPVNEKPEITGTPSLVTTSTYDENTTGNVADYNARDEEGSTIAWSLTGTDRGDFAISTDGIVTFKNTPDFEDPEDSDTDNVFTFNVVASDSVKTNSVAVTVTVADVEEAGVITVSNPDPGVGDEIRFDLTDPDGGLTAAGITWFTDSRSPGGAWGTAHGRFPQGGSSTTTFVLYRAPEQETGSELRVRAEYTDRRGTGKEATSPETQPVTADPIANAPPRFTGGNNFTIAEGVTGRNVGSPLSTSDRDGDSVTFAMEAGGDSDFFEINASTGQLRLARVVDFETQPAVGFYLPAVTIHDGKGVDADNNVTTDTTVDATASVTVNIIDVEEVGVVTLSADEPESGTALDATLEDGDGSVSGESWQWARSANGRTNWFNIAGETSSTYTPTEDDEDFYLRARVEYTDNRGSGKSAEGITGGRVPSENRRPVFPDSETGERSVDENTRAGANIGAPVAAVDPESNRLTYTLTGADADAFTIVIRTGQIKVKDALDFETPGDDDSNNVYEVTVNVHDGRDGAGASSTTIDNSQDVTITVQNVDEPGVVTLTTLTGAVQARVEVTAALSDDDGSVTGVAWQWSQSPNGRTDWANISGETGTTYTPTDAFERRFIRATASYTDGHGASKTARGVSPRVAKAPPVNSPPAFPTTEDGRREVAEDATGGAPVGAPVVATDVNAGDSAVNAALSYSLSGTDAASFEIDAASGQLSLAQNVTLDYEGKRSYRVTVEVTDGHDELGDDEDPDVTDARQNVTINVTDVNEAPVVTGEAAPSVRENSDRAVATYSAKDPERDTLTWSVSGNEFWISDRGQLHFAAPPSFEGRPSYTVTVTATDDDATPLSGSFDVTVTVTDVEEEGTVVITPPRGWDGTSFTAGLTDGDGVTGSIIWRWARSSGRSGGTVIPGATSSSYTATVDDVNQYLRVTATYDDDRGSGKTAEAVLSGRIGSVDDRPTDNTAPEFAETTGTRSIGQGTAAGRSIGARVRATDPDAGDILIYSLSGTDADAFDIDPATGQLRTKAVLDYDPDPQAENTNTVTVNVHDGFDNAYGPSTNTDATIDVTITVTRVTRRPPSPPSQPSTDATLSALTLSGIDFDLFAPTTTSYTAQVASSVTETTVTPTTTHAGASYVIKLGGATDADGVIALGVGSNVITVEVTAQDGQATQTYTVTVTRAAGLSSDATLSSLTLSGIDFGTFDPATTSYRARVSSETTETTVTPTVTHSAASYVIKLGGVTDADGVVSLSEDSNVIAVDVTAEDGETSQTYTVTVARGPSPCVTGGAVSDSTNTGLVSDCDALLAVKDTLAGTASLNWSADTSMASWEGLTLLGTPERVAGLSLSNKSLDGEIPSELGDLSMLAKLDLHSNQLSGSVPGSLVRLSKLTRLNLRSNQLSGSIPGSLGRLTRLTVLNLHSNDLSGDIPDLSTTMLQELYLASNYDEMVEGSGLTGPVPAWLNGMTNMRELWLWGNRLSGTIPDLSRMTSLQKLKLAANDLTGGIPASLGSMSNLKWLIIQGNPLGGAIPDLSGMTSLTHLWLHSNELTGSIPSGDELPPNVDDLNLRDNMLAGRIPDLSSLDMATRVRLHNNMLSGEVPATLGDLDRLRQLWLHGNRLTSIAAELGDLSDTLIEIALRRNSWTDDACVPAALANVATNDYQEAGLEACGNDGGS